MRRALDCFCGEYLEGDDEKELRNWTKAHVERHHPKMQPTEEQVR